MAQWCVRGVMVVASCAMVLVNGASGQAIPRNLQSWQVDFTISGTIRGLNEHLALNQAGELTADQRSEPTHVAGHASPELLAKVKAWLQVARPTKPDPNLAIPDALLLSAVLTAGGRQYPLEMPGDLYGPLQDAFNTLYKQALLGHWRQSAWKLCTPVKELQPSDVDLPIDDLSFRPDGTFTVRWRGGAHTTSIPHKLIPDYQGHYEVYPENGYLSMKYNEPNPQYDRAILIPRDFSGAGHFTIMGNQLTLHNIWLGTREAKKKPDICELTFTREVETAPPIKTKQ